MARGMQQILWLLQPDLVEKRDMMVPLRGDSHWFSQRKEIDESWICYNSGIQIKDSMLCYIHLM